MGTVLSSIDNMLKSAAEQGTFVRHYASIIPSAATAATVNCGYTTGFRYPEIITIPSLGPGVTGALFTNIQLVAITANTIATCGIEYILGTLTGDSGTGIFAAGVVMPTKTIGTSRIQTASQKTFLYISTVLPAVSPVITITYTDQDGNTGATAVLTLPASSAINTIYDITPHLTAGDTGIRAVTAMSWTNSPASGVAKVLGVLVLQQGALGEGSIIAM